MTPSHISVIAATSTLSCHRKYAQRTLWKLRQRLLHWMPAFFIILCVVIALCVVLEGTCESNLKLVDTRIIRKFKSPTCPKGAPCLVYLTLNQDPSHSIIVNYHTAEKTDRSICRYGLNSTIVNNTTNVTYNFEAQGDSFKMPGIEVDRYVHWVHLTELIPSTIYYVQCGGGGGGQSDNWSKELAFRTQTDDPNTKVTFVVGGDVDTTSTAERISVLAAMQSPSFALVGGDLAYDRAQYSCYRIVDKWLATWQRVMVTPEGLTVPIVAAIGNHEVIGDYDASSMTIGGPNGTMYPTIRKYENSYSRAVREAWLDLFDQFSFQIAFENHDHAYKRTKSMRNSVPGLNGTVYMGDGSWGVHHRSVPATRWYQTITQSVNYVLVVEINQTDIGFKAISDEGYVFDEGTVSSSQ
eukprot:gene19969-23930_t